MPVLEIRFHGRGGQGSVIAAELLARAAFKEGKDVQSFPFFGVERRGAPVAAFTRIDDRPIRLRTSITAPDIVIVLDPSLLRTVAVTAGAKPGGLLLVNTDRTPDALGLPFKGRTATVDATSIAIAHGLGSKTQPIVNTAILGAFAKVGGAVSIGSVVAAIRESVPAKREENAAAAEDAYGKVLLAAEAVA
jgi:2-oxoacid:acceptor oxidoreductase gamma subunit (pyruvate/2-ketoisovalerate family)